MAGSAAVVKAADWEVVVMVAATAAVERAEGKEVAVREAAKAAGEKVAGSEEVGKVEVMEAEATGAAKAVVVKAAETVEVATEAGLVAEIGRAHV